MGWGGLSWCVLFREGVGGGGLCLVPGGEESDEWVRVLAGVLNDARVEVLVLCVE